jgi:hypothetical protein
VPGRQDSGSGQRATATATADSTRRTAHGWRRVRSSELGVASCDGLFSRSALLRDLSEAKSAGLLRDLSEAKSADLLPAACIHMWGPMHLGGQGGHPPCPPPGTAVAGPNTRLLPNYDGAHREALPLIFQKEKSYLYFCTSDFSAKDAHFFLKEKDAQFCSVQPAIYMYATPVEAT